MTDLITKNQNLTQQLNRIKIYIETLEHQSQVVNCETQQLKQQLKEKTVEKDQEMTQCEDVIFSLKYQLQTQRFRVQVKSETQPDSASESKWCKCKPQTIKCENTVPQLSTEADDSTNHMIICEVA